jgi:hypothetical protein
MVRFIAFSLISLDLKDIGIKPSVRIDPNGLNGLDGLRVTMGSDFMLRRWASMRRSISILINNNSLPPL